LHYKKQTKPYSAQGKDSIADVLIKDLKNIVEFKDYGKANLNYFEVIIEHLDRAITNSKDLVKSGLAAGDKDHYINPATYMHKLVDVFEEVYKHNKNQKQTKKQRLR
jgi:hypothetical protein